MDLNHDELGPNFALYWELLSSRTQTQIAQPPKEVETQTATAVIDYIESGGFVHEHESHLQDVGKLNIDPNMILPAMKSPCTYTPLVQPLPIPALEPHTLTPEQESRNKVVNELISTERSYIEFMHTVIELLLLPLRSSVDPIISEDDIDVIFSNIETIKNLSVELYTSLDTRIKSFTDENVDDMTIGDILASFAPYFKTYFIYVDNHPRSDAKIKSLRESNWAFDSMLNQFRANPRANKMDIHDLLIKPVQRIPHYLILIESLLKATSTTLADYALLQKAHIDIKTVADYVNVSAAESENRAKVYQIQNKLVRLNYQELVQPSRRYITEGEIYKINLETGMRHSRILYLFSDVVFVATPLIGGSLKADKILPLLTAVVVDKRDYGDQRDCFWILTPTKTQLFLCTSKKSKSDWMDAINRAGAALIESNPHVASKRLEYEIVIDGDGIPCLEPIKSTDDTGNSTKESGDTVSRSNSKKSSFKSTMASAFEGLVGFMNRQPTLHNSQDEFIIIDESTNREHKMQLNNLKGVKEVGYAEILAEDKRHESWPADTPYLVFQESEANIFTKRIGYIEIANRGDEPLTLVAHKRKVKDKAASYSLPGHSQNIFDFKGQWCIEVRGNSGDLEVVQFATSGGSGTNNGLSMVS